MKSTVGTGSSTDGPVRGINAADDNFRTGTAYASPTYGSASKDNAPAAQAHNNMPPYVGILFLVRMKLG